MKWFEIETRKIVLFHTTIFNVAEESYFMDRENSKDSTGAMNNLVVGVHLPDFIWHLQHMFCL